MASVHSVQLRQMQYYFGLFEVGELHNYLKINGEYCVIKELHDGEELYFVVVKGTTDFDKIAVLTDKKAYYFELDGVIKPDITLLISEFNGRQLPVGKNFWMRKAASRPSYIIIEEELSEPDPKWDYKAGTFGSVWKALFTPNRGVARETFVVAVKGSTAGGIGKEMILHEARLLNDLQQKGGHKNIVLLIGITLFRRIQLVLEFCNDQSMDFYVQKQGGEEHIDNKQKLSWLRDICAGMGFLVENSMIHRDLHPGNIFLHDQSAKIGDFGLAQYTQDERALEAVDVKAFAENILAFLYPNSAKQCTDAQQVTLSSSSGSGGPGQHMKNKPIKPLDDDELISQLRSVYALCRTADVKQTFRELERKMSELINRI